MTKAPTTTAPTDHSIKQVEDCIETLLAAKGVQASMAGERYGDLVAQLNLLLKRGGKRLRPKLVIVAYEAYGGADRSAIVKVAASQELFHAFILIHDDIIDRDLMRWGGPNIAGHYIKEFAARTNAADANHYANAWALLAGDLCYSLSFEALLGSGFKPSALMRAVELVQQTLLVMIGGEVIDVSLPMDKPIDEPINEDLLINLYDIKTASYSFCTPLRLGALFAGANTAQDKALLAFGQQIGIAFQIKDDILDIFGDETTIGKSILSDIREGKRTILINTAFQLAKPSQVDQLKNIIGNPNANHDDLKVVRTILTSSSALSRTETLMQQYCQRAHHILLTAGFPQQLCEHLADLVSFCAKRTA